MSAAETNFSECQCQFIDNVQDLNSYTGHTQKNVAFLIVFTIKTAPFFCVCPV
jgi:hypothetical protein